MPDPTPEELHTELSNDEPLTPQRLQRLRQPIRDYTDQTVPRGIAAVKPWWRDHREGILDALAEVVEQHTCEECDTSFDSAQGLASHARVHRDE